MSRWFKRVSKERSQDLLPEETLRAATYFQGFGSASIHMARGLATAGRGSAILEGAAEGINEAREAAGNPYSASEGSLAAALSNPVGVLAVTDKRLIVFGFSQGFFTTKILDPTAIFPIEQVAGWSYKPGSLVGTLNLAFSDGSSAGLEIPRANMPAAFARTLDIPTVK